MKTTVRKVRQISGDQRRSNGKVLTEILATLQTEGATAARLIPVRDIIVDERVRLKCQIPLCDSYNKNLMCPPRVPSVADFRVALARFSQAMLIQVSAPLERPPENRPSSAVFAPAGKLHELVNLTEKLAFEKGFRFATGLIGGCCRLCETCAAVQPGQFCRFPFKARPSMEAMGIDVMATTEKTGWAMSFPVIDRITWTGVVLI
jgi:predicted metal-binding protein